MATVFTFLTSKRFIIYETQFQKALSIIEQVKSDKNDRWETKQHILLPNVVYHKLSKPPAEKTILERKRKIDSVDSEDWDIESLHRCDLPMLPIQIERILCSDDCAMVPITDNQMGFFREVESLEYFWEVEHDPASPSPQVSPEVLACTEDEETKEGDDMSMSPEIVTPDSTRTVALEPPPVKNAKKQEKKLLKRF